MGCGPSTPVNSNANSHATLSTVDPASRPGSKTTGSGRNKSVDSILGDDREQRSHSRTSNRDSGIDSAKTSDGRRRQAADHNANRQTNGNAAPDGSRTADGGNSPQKALAFEVMVDSENQPQEGESIIAKHPPRRLQKLDLRREPTLTAEMIEEKQRATEERRRQVLADRAKSSKKSSRRRKDLIVAMQFGNIQDSAEIQKRLDEKVDSASKLRAKRQEDVISKQRKRELRAKQAKERVRRMQEDENAEHSFDVERDENFMADDDGDSWLDGENNNVLGSASTTSERIYDGRSSPMKKVGDAGKKAGMSYDFDSDEEEDEGWATKSQDRRKLADKDDFFDS